MLEDYGIELLPKTSSATVKRLKSIGIKTFFDLINYFPSRYEDYSVISQIGFIQEGENVTIKGEIVNISQIYTRSHLRLQKAKIKDETGTAEITWYNQPYLVTLLKTTKYLAVSGQVVRFMNKVVVEPKEYEVLRTVNDLTYHTGRIIPIYPEKKGLSSRLLRTKILSALDSMKFDDKSLIAEFVPESMNFQKKFMPEKNAYEAIHFPKSYEQAEKARERLSFDELLLIQLSAAKVRSEWALKRTNTPINIEKCKGKIDFLIKRLPFELTNAQKKVLKEILSDLSKGTPMNRFLQGDVGSGKTIVAALGCYASYLNGYRSIMMAPTEILAKQHFSTVSNLFRGTKVKVALQTGSEKHIYGSNKDFDILIGTHALLSKKITFNRVALIVIDEQHRFGVEQRAKLRLKGNSPHLLTMTATPIPRTVVLTLHGELDFSVIDEMPKGRKTVRTYLVPSVKKNKGYQWINTLVQRQRCQVFIICPLIEESEIETLKSVKAAKDEYERLKNEVFPDLRIGLLHGKMKFDDKDDVMQRFKKIEYDILVSTSVVEVGIDIPNAKIMVIEGADRFGLAQLHQLRGRVGRDNSQSYCLLYTDRKDLKTLNKLRYFASHHDGLALAEYDLKSRGPGSMFGILQHGYSDLKIASLTDYKLIDLARIAASELIQKEGFKFSSYPLLNWRFQKQGNRLIARD